MKGFIARRPTNQELEKFGAPHRAREEVIREILDPLGTNDEAIVALLVDVAASLRMMRGEP